MQPRAYFSRSLEPMGAYRSLQPGVLCVVEEFGGRGKEAEQLENCGFCLPRDLVCAKANLLKSHTFRHRIISNLDSTKFLA
jgi:hypothetical protein